MKYNAKGHKRKSIRLKGYDYSQQGMYFVTVCTNGKKCNLGKVINDEVQLNKYGHIVRKELLESSSIRKEICINEYVIMPNHIHGIITINDKNVGANNHSPLQINQFRSPSKTIGSMIRGFKIGVTKWFRANTNVYNVWQRNYYEHIIRNEKKLNKIREYIINNPLKWRLDRENPDRKGSDKLEDEIFSSKGVPACTYSGRSPYAPTIYKYYG